MWFHADTDVSLNIDYLVDAEFVVPTSAAYVVRGHTGTVLVSGALPAASTSEAVVLLASDNGIGTDPTQNRYLTVTFLSGGRTYQVHKNYSLIPFIPMTGTPEQVRGVIGLDTSELPDAEVNLVSSYLELVYRYGSEITAALTTTGARNLSVNKLIVLNAALAISSSIELRTKITVRSEDSMAARSARVDFDAVIGRIQTTMAPLVDSALGSSPVTPTIFGLSEPTDAITG